LDSESLQRGRMVDKEKEIKESITANACRASRGGVEVAHRAAKIMGESRLEKSKTRRETDVT